MKYLNTFDYVVISVYFSILVGLGLYLKKKASASLEDYCIGNRSLPWWALGMSGMASWLDVAGTMLIVSFLFILGPRGLYIEFRGGAGLLLPFMLLFVGKWMRRSQCLTPAEWMIFRFGDGFGGRFAQFASAFGAIATTVGMLAYLVKAIGLFLSTFLPLSPFACAILLVVVATVYTMVSGFYGVVFTDVFQAGIIMLAVIIVSTMAWFKIAGTENFAAVAAEVTGQQNWISSAPHFRVDMPAGYTVYKDLFMFAVFYLLNNIFRGLGFPGDPKYFGARSDRECGTLTFLWTIMMTFRWPLMIGFATLGIFLVKDLYPNQGLLMDAMVLIKQHVPDVTKPQWPTLLSNIINNPGSFPPEMIDGLRDIFASDDWAMKIKLLSYEGTVNPERILPAVLLFSIPAGFRGLMMIALIAASMSTFDTHVNLSAGIMTRDIYQKYVRPRASTKELIYMTWLFVVVIVALGFLFAYSLESINDVWGWIVMGLGAGALVPGFLRLYWWRFNGGGFAWGTIFGMAGAVLHRIVLPNLEPNSYWDNILRDERWMFGIILAIGFVGSIIGTYLTKPEDDEVVEKFYRRTKPFGLWGPFKERLSEEERKEMNHEHLYDICAIPFVLLWQVTMFLLPMQIIVRSFKAFGFTFVLFAIGMTGMYFFWYRKLPPASSPNKYPEPEPAPAAVDEDAPGHVAAKPESDRT